MDSVKTSLKTRILQRRQQYGLGDLRVDFSPKPNHPLTVEEEAKEKRRKESNRKSAMKSRIKTKTQDEQNRKLLDKESHRKEQLLKKIKLLNDQKVRSIKQLREMGIPDQHVQAAMASIRPELLSHTSLRTCERSDIDRPHYSQTYESSNTMSSNYSSDSESFAVSTDSNDSSNASVTFVTNGTVNYSGVPAYSNGSNPSLCYNDGLPAFSALGEQIRQHQERETAISEEAEEILMNFETLDQVSTEEVSNVVGEGSEVLFGEYYQGHSDTTLYLENHDAFTTQPSSMTSFPIRQALMCM